jgi:hypothetical protein
MKDFPTELVYILMIFVAMVFQYLMKRFGLTEQAEASPKESLPQLPAGGEETPPIPAMSNGQDLRIVDLSGEPGMESGAVRKSVQRRFGRVALMGTRREVQNAFVIAAVLSPCRAFEPHDTR